MSWAAPDGWDSSEGLLTSPEVAALYGVSVQTVSNWARHGTIPAIRPGGEWRFSRKWVREDRLTKYRGGSRG
jgi:excisionase family DNA binding protein